MSIIYQYEKPRLSVQNPMASHGLPDTIGSHCGSQFASGVWDLLVPALARVMFILDRLTVRPSVETESQEDFKVRKFVGNKSHTTSCRHWRML